MVKLYWLSDGEWARIESLLPRGGRTTKIHALSDDQGRPLAFQLTAGNTHDLDGARALLAIVPCPRAAARRSRLRRAQPAHLARRTRCRSGDSATTHPQASPHL